MGIRFPDYGLEGCDNDILIVDTNESSRTTETSPDMNSNSISNIIQTSIQ